MNEKNVKDMEDGIFYGGFSDIVSVKKLHEYMASGIPEFKLTGSTSYPDQNGGNNTVEPSLNYKLSEKGNYYNPSFDLKVTKADGTVLEQNFKNNFGDKYSLKEAYNMLEGRYVTKQFLPIPKVNEETGERMPRQKDEDGKLMSYTATAYLDLSEKKDGNFALKKIYNFDLDKKLAEYPFKELNYAQSKADFIDALARGNRQAATVPNPEGPDQPDVRKYVEVNGKFKTLDVYDANMKPDRFFLSNWKESQQQKDQGASQSVGQENKQEQDNKIKQEVSENKAKEKKQQKKTTDENKPDKAQRQRRGQRA